MTDYKINLERKNIQEKIQKIEEVQGQMSKCNSLALIELKNLPDVLLQTSRKKIRKEGGSVVVAKKAIFQRVFEKDPKLKKFLEKINEPIALVLSNSTPYELAKFFKTNKKKMAAKVGQISPYEIVVPAGETDLPPGPALSELKVAGVSVQIKSGKIAVSKDSVLAKEGEEITDKKAKALQMLGILPFEKYVNVLYAYDGEYIYNPEALSIDDQYVNEGIPNSLNQGINLSLNADYPTELTVEILVTNAYMQGSNLAINGKIYSKGSMEQLLSLAYKQGMVLSEIDPPKESKKESPEKPSEEPKEEKRSPGEKPKEEPKLKEEKSEAKAEEKKGE